MYLVFSGEAYEESGIGAAFKKKFPVLDQAIFFAEGLIHGRSTDWAEILRFDPETDPIMLEVVHVRWNSVKREAEVTKRNAS